MCVILFLHECISRGKGAILHFCCPYKKCVWIRNISSKSDTPFSPWKALMMRLDGKWFQWYSVSTAIHSAVLFTEVTEMLLLDRKDWSAKFIPGIKKFSLRPLCFWNLMMRVMFYPATALILWLAVSSAVLSTEALLHVPKWPSRSRQFRSVKACVGGCGCRLLCVQLLQMPASW